MCLRDIVLQLVERDWFSIFKATKGFGLNSGRVLCFQRWGGGVVHVCECTQEHSSLGGRWAALLPLADPAALESPQEHVFYQSCAENCRVPRTSQALLVKIHLPCALFIACLLQLGPWDSLLPLVSNALLWPLAVPAAGCWCSDLELGSLPHQNTGKNRLWD